MAIIGYDYGNTASLDATYANSLLCNKFTAGSTGALQSLSLYMKGTGGGNLICGIYTDNGSNNPGTLVATTAAAACSVTNSYQTLNTTTNPAINSGTTYWFVYMHSATASNLICLTNGVSGCRWGYYNTSWGALPATFPGNISGPYDGLAISQYGTLGSLITGSAVIDESAWSKMVDGYMVVGGEWKQITKLQVASGGAWTNQVP
jgi:hypothetical protein